jgi:hypothetical protein
MVVFEYGYATRTTYPLGLTNRYARGGDGGANGSLRISSCRQFPIAIPIKSPTKSETAILNFHGSIALQSRPEVEKASPPADAFVCMVTPQT